MARGKSISQYCAHCERVTKMSLIGAIEDQQEKSWYRCTRCRHSMLVDVVALKEQEEASKKKLEKTDCTVYSPADTYEVGQAIFHSEWDDLGKVTSKERTSAGASAIVVSFEKLGERKLLENLIDSNENE